MRPTLAPSEARDYWEIIQRLERLERGRDGTGGSGSTTIIPGAGLTLSGLVLDVGAGQGIQVNADTVQISPSANLPGTPTVATPPGIDDNSTKIATTGWYVGQLSSFNPLMDGVADPGTSLRAARATHVHPSDTSRAALTAGNAFSGSNTFTNATTNFRSGAPGTTLTISLGRAANDGTIGVAGSAGQVTSSSATGDLVLIAGPTGNSVHLGSGSGAAGISVSNGSATLRGTPVAPTAAVDTNTTQIATTAYVVGQGYAKLASPTFSGTLTAPTINASTTLQVGGTDIFARSNTWTNANTQFRSGASGTNLGITLGRTATEATVAIAAAGGAFSTSAVAGDMVIRVESASQSIHLNAGTGAASVSVTSYVRLPSAVSAVTGLQLGSSGDVSLWRASSGKLGITDGAIGAASIGFILGGGNRLYNSSFEAAPATDADPATGVLTFWDGWSVTSGTVTAVTASTVEGRPRVWGIGNNAFKVTGITAATDWELSVVTARYVSVQPGEKYTLTIYGGSNAAGDKVALGARWYDETGVALAGPNDITVATDQDISQTAMLRPVWTFTAPAGAYRARPFVRIPAAYVSNTDNYYFDSIQWEKGELPTAYSPRPDEILPGSITATMIQAGAIYADALTADVLLANQRVVVGAAAGARVEISGTNQRISAYNSTPTEVLRISGGSGLDILASATADFTVDPERQIRWQSSLGGTVLGRIALWNISGSSELGLKSQSTSTTATSNVSINAVNSDETSQMASIHNAVSASVHTLLFTTKGALSKTLNLVTNDGSVVTSDYSFADRTNLKARGAFSAHRNGTALSTLATTWTVVVGGTSEASTNADGWYSTSTGKYTPLVAGFHILHGGVGMVAQTGVRMIAAIWKNGAEYKRLGDIVGAATSGYEQVQGSVLVLANGSTDYFELRVWTGSATTNGIEGASTATYFQGSFTGV